MPRCVAHVNVVIVGAAVLGTPKNNDKSKWFGPVRHWLLRGHHVLSTSDSVGPFKYAKSIDERCASCFVRRRFRVEACSSLGALALADLPRAGSKLGDSLSWTKTQLQEMKTFSSLKQT